MGSVVLALTVLAYVVVGRAAALTWKTLLHWAGEILLIAGILLAAKGISDVRRDWTGRPGISGRVRQTARIVGAWIAASMWLRWNRALEALPRLAKLLHLHEHRTHKRSEDHGVGADAAKTDAAAPPGEVVITGSTLGAYLADIERRIAETEKQIDGLHLWHEHEVKDRQDAADQERAERRTEDQSIREGIANLAGGGLRLQTWGVVCLLAGTIMTAIW